MKKIRFYQVKKKEYLKGFDADLTLEVNFDDKTLMGKFGGFDHHTKENQHLGSPCNNPALHNFKNIDYIEKILILDDDMDVYVSSMALIFNDELQALGSFETSTFWSSVAMVDSHGVIAIEDGKIPEKDVYIMEAVWAAKKKGLLPSFWQKPESKIYDVTDIMYEHVNFIFKCLTNSEREHENIIEEWKKDTIAKINDALICESPLIRIFETSGVPVNSAYYSKDLQRKVPLILSLNTNTGKIRLSTTSSEIDCKKLVQDFWGVSAGGHPGIGVSPREKRMNHLDLFEFHNFLEKKLKSLFL